MVIGRFSKPPPPSLPKEAPWTDVQELIKRSNRLIALLESGAGVPVSKGKELEMPPLTQIPFKSTVAAKTGAYVIETVARDSTVKLVTIHWPPGCNALVGVRVGHSKHFFLPPEGYGEKFISLDSVTKDFEANEPVKGGEDLQVEIQNNDTQNEHTISAIALLKED